MNWKFVMGILVGFVAHQTEPFVRRSFGPGWREMVSYTLGVLITYPVALANFDELKDVENQEKRFYLSWMSSFLAVGLGTLLGWIFFNGDHNE